MDRAIERDFKRFENKKISKELLDKTWDACKKYEQFHRYQIVDSVVFGPESRIKILLQEITRKFKVPNVDFIYYYEDRIKPTFFKRSRHRVSAPIFVSAKDRSLSQVILFADWNYNIQDQSSGWNHLIEIINSAFEKSAWKTKKEKLFWRGTPWDGKHFGMYTFANWKTIPRGRLVAASRKNPGLIDAAFSSYPAICEKEDLKRCTEEMGEISYLSWDAVLEHKYQVIVDGVTCSFPATQWKLLSGALCFKCESPNIQYYYGELIPWKHYIPLKKDLSDVIEKILWARDHDEKAREIAENGRSFALEHLMPEHIMLYCYKVLCKYARLQDFLVTSN